MTKAQDAPSATAVDTEVIRVMVFKDTFSKDWQSFSQGPVKVLISLLPALQKCPACGGACKFFHPALDEEVSQVVLDVWAWRWTSIDSKKKLVPQAEVFSVFIRVPKSALVDILALSGWNGIFLEPRPSNKVGNHPLFVVVWLPKNYTLEQALDLKRRHDQILGVARMQMKFGLRALKKHETFLQKLVYPDKEVTVCTIKAVYEVGPLPHGLSHAQVTQLLRAWNWIGRPLRPFALVTWVSIGRLVRHQDLQLLFCILTMVRLLRLSVER